MKKRIGKAPTNTPQQDLPPTIIESSSAFSLVPPTNAPPLDPALSLLEAEHTARNEVAAGAHDVLTLPEPSLPYRDTESWIGMQTGLARLRELQTEREQRMLLSHCTAEREIASHALNDCETRISSLKQRIDEVEDDVSSTYSRLALSMGRVGHRWGRVGRWTLLLMLIGGDLVFTATAIEGINMSSVEAYAIAATFAAITLAAAHGLSLTLRFKVIPLAWVIAVSAALYLLIFAAGFGVLRQRIILGAGSAVELSGTQIATVITTFVAATIMLNMAVFIIEFLGNSPLIHELITVTHRMEQAEQALPALREAFIRADEKVKDADAQLAFITRHYEQLLATVPAVAESMVRQYDLTLLEAMGSPDATTSLASLRRPSDEEEIALRAV